MKDHRRSDNVKNYLISVDLTRVFDFIRNSRFSYKLIHLAVQGLANYHLGIQPTWHTSKGVKTTNKYSVIVVFISYGILKKCISCRYYVHYKKITPHKKKRMLNIRFLVQRGTFCYSKKELLTFIIYRLTCRLVILQA